MLTQTSLAQLLKPFELKLSSEQTGQIATYLDILMKWNRKINLTALRTAEECVTRHFGESLYLSHWLHLKGRLLDIGSGAGFPGLALKISCPSLEVTLLEPASKKRAFLKEVARACQMGRVEVLGERLQDFVSRGPSYGFQIVTSRAVGQFDRLVPFAIRCLTPGGRLCLWSTSHQAPGLFGTTSAISWERPKVIPLSSHREIWIGTLPLEAV